MQVTQGVDIEIVGKPGKWPDEPAIVKPMSVKINGVETFTPDGTEIHIDAMLGRGAVTVTMTMLARSISIKPAESLPDAE